MLRQCRIIGMAAILFAVFCATIALQYRAEARQTPGAPPKNIIPVYLGISLAAARHRVRMTVDGAPPTDAIITSPYKAGDISSRGATVYFDTTLVRISTAPSQKRLFERSLPPGVGKIVVQTDGPLDKSRSEWKIAPKLPTTVTLLITPLPEKPEKPASKATKPVKSVQSADTRRVVIN